MKLSIILSTLAVFGSTLAIPQDVNSLFKDLVSHIRGSVVDIQVVLDHKYTDSGYNAVQKIQRDFNFYVPITLSQSYIEKGKFTSCEDVLDLIKQFSAAMEKTTSGAIKVIKSPAMSHEVKSAIYKGFDALASHFHLPGSTIRSYTFEDAFRKACPKQSPVFNVVKSEQLAPAIIAMRDAYLKSLRNS